MKNANNGRKNTRNVKTTRENAKNVSPQAWKESKRSSGQQRKQPMVQHSRKYPAQMTSLLGARTVMIRVWSERLPFVAITCYI